MMIDVKDYDTMMSFCQLVMTYVDSFSDMMHFDN